MFSKNRFKAAFVEIGMSMQDVANELGINKGYALSQNQWGKRLFS